MVDLGKKPLRCANISDWLAIQTLIPDAKPAPPGEKAKSIKPKSLPGIIIACGGRKIRIPVGGNRYAFDMGKFPEQVDHEMFSNPDVYGEDAIHSTLRNISYKDIIKAMRDQHGGAIDNKTNVNAVLGILRGEDLPLGVSNHVPVMTCALFASEVARNPVSMVSTLLLLDLIDREVSIPHHDNVKFQFENCLWGDEPCGGFFPMCHIDSMKAEFPEDPYTLTDPLQYSHFKSFVVIVEWCKIFLQMKLEEVDETSFWHHRTAGESLHMSHVSSASLYTDTFNTTNKLIGETIVNTIVSSYLVSRFVPGAEPAPKIYQRPGTMHHTANGFIKFSETHGVLPHWSDAKNFIFCRRDYGIDEDDPAYENADSVLHLASGVLQFGDLRIQWCQPKIPGKDCKLRGRCSHGAMEKDCAYHGELHIACEKNDVERVKQLHGWGCGLTKTSLQIARVHDSVDCLNYLMANGCV